MSHFAITIPVSGDQAEILIAQLATVGFEGFEEQETQLVAFIPESDFDEQVLQEMLGTNLSYTKELIQQQNWNAVWESNFDPVLVDDFCGIRADFHPAFDPAPQHVIEITPKMSFGTGHHATTSSMIRLMRDISFEGKTVFDFGTGTGILAILAEKLGAKEVDAIDYDEWAVNNTKENLEANHTTKIQVWQADNLDAISKKYDILLANINFNVLLQYMADMRRILSPGGILLLSGIMPTDETQIVAAATPHGFHLQQRIEKNNWLALQFNVQ
ncbi:50S ribosomal protein L11 methyltransferase [Chitinophaga sp. Cy-1792]|uniref:50S ribosomal protein L11 methyltransferase n=1 Tax=Chitinophaga sp. Cy-1792 TaxID=2608339 RepID=UPI001420DDF2|nr:50S ribosomal protein L11 methyltransferase [Chitinophaga sp. Cy-1792]NIG57335.1 50S ribosomal protein L11 methyltransferase [Chitinophaga sp. Cy-1792]